MKKLLVVIVALMTLTSCAGRITGPNVTDSSEDIHGEGHTLAEYIAIVRALDSDPEAWPEGCFRADPSCWRPQ